MSLLAFWKNSFAMLSRAMVLIYPLLLLDMVLAMAMPTLPKPLSQLKPDWRLALMAFLLWALYSAIEAGRYAMLAKAVTSFSPASNPKTTPPSATPLTSQWQLLAEFFPGVGQFFLPLMAGFALQGLVACLLLLGAHCMMLALYGHTYGQQLWHILNHVPSAPTIMAQTQLLAASLTTAQRHLLDVFGWVMLGTLLSALLLHVLTQTWTAWLFVRQKTLGQAFMAAIQQVLKHWPFFAALTSGFWLLLIIVNAFPTGGNNSLLGMLQGLLLFMLQTMFALGLFQTVAESPQPPSQNLSS